MSDRRATANPKAEKTHLLSRPTSSSSTSVFVATIIISLGLLLCTCAFIWEVLRCCRRRASNKGWRALQDERTAAPVGMSLYEPRNSSGLYDDPSAGQRQGGVQMRAGGTAPPPLPPMPRGYQMSFRPPPPQAQPHPQPQRTHSHPAPLLPAPQQSPAPLRTASVPTGSAHRLQLQDVVLTSPVDPMKESHQVSDARPREVKKLTRPEQTDVSDHRRSLRPVPWFRHSDR